MMLDKARPTRPCCYIFCCYYVFRLFALQTELFCSKALGFAQFSRDIYFFQTLGNKDWRYDKPPSVLTLHSGFFLISCSNIIGFKSINENLSLILTKIYSKSSNITKKKTKQNDPECFLLWSLAKRCARVFAITYVKKLRILSDTRKR